MHLRTEGDIKSKIGSFMLDIHPFLKNEEFFQTPLKPNTYHFPEKILENSVKKIIV